MKKSRFSEEQIVGILKEHQAGATAALYFASTWLQSIQPRSRRHGSQFSARNLEPERGGRVLASKNLGRRSTVMLGFGCMSS